MDGLKVKPPCYVVPSSDSTSGSSLSKVITLLCIRTRHFWEVQHFIFLKIETSRDGTCSSGSEMRRPSATQRLGPVIRFRCAAEEQNTRRFFLTAGNIRGSGDSRRRG